MRRAAVLVLAAMAWAGEPGFAEPEPRPFVFAQDGGARAPVPELPGGTVYAISPSDADPGVKRFLTDNLVAFKRGVAKDANLLAFFPPTGGTPTGSWPFMEAAANLGYRVIGLTYDNTLSVPQACGRNPDPACSDRFRQKRVFGDDVTKDIDDLPGEAIVPRLTKLLQYLDAHYHREGWGRYLQNGQPDWSRIAVAGHSQGAGMAAYIAKRYRVARVIVLSGAWDRVEGTKEWAPWVTSPSATPLDRWYAAYHEKETRADAMKAAYVALQIPPDHIRVMTLEPRQDSRMSSRGDLYHMSMDSPLLTPLDASGAPAYAADWASLLGSPK